MVILAKRGNFLDIYFKACFPEIHLQFQRLYYFCYDDQHLEEGNIHTISLEVLP